MAISKTKICLFGGTFDPIHLGHTYIATEVLRLGLADRVIFIPCKQSPHKQDRQNTADHHRLAMCKAAVKGIDNMEVSDWELNAPSPSYSWRTAEAMQQHYPNSDLFWLMGTDQWQALPHWSRANYLSSLVKFIVFTRGTPVSPLADFQSTALHGRHPASASQIREDLSFGLEPRWLTPSVLNYLKENRLYQKSPLD